MGESEQERAQAASRLHPLARSTEQWADLLESMGERRFRGAQVFHWIHGRGVFSPEAMTNLGKPLRERLAAEAIELPLGVREVRRSPDGVRKILSQLSDGALLECVVIPMTRDAEGQDADLAALDEEPSEEATSTTDAGKTKVTLCVSTQVGCAMGCVFCASGQAGLRRGLSAAEVVAQVFLAKQVLEPGEELRNLVFMGMGEPLHHYQETARSLRLITHPDGLAIGPRRITVSTVGLVPGIERLGRDFNGKIGLAISLHAPSDALRSRLLPINQRYPLAELMAALKRYPLPRRRRITIEYTLIHGVNDRSQDAERLALLLRGLAVKVNLIPLNPVENVAMAAPPAASVEQFRRTLAARHINCSVRKRRGDDVDAACGQLALGGAGALVQLGRTREAEGPATRGAGRGGR